MGLLAAGHGRPHRWVVRSGAADVGTAGEDLHHAKLDERLEDPLEDWLQRVGDRVQLERDHPVLGVQLVDRVQWCVEKMLPAYAASASALIAVLTEMVAQTEVLAGQVEQGFGRHPDAEIYRSQPGLGTILGARVLAEFGDDPKRYADAKARKNYSGMSPITKASGTRKVVLARYARNRRLGDALFLQAYSALRSSPGARACYDRQRARGATHYQALRAVANRLVGILHGCLRHRTLYDENRAWHTDGRKLATAA